MARKHIQVRVEGLRNFRISPLRDQLRLPHFVQRGSETVCKKHLRVGLPLETIICKMDWHSVIQRMASR